MLILSDKFLDNFLNNKNGVPWINFQIWGINTWEMGTHKVDMPVLHRLVSVCFVVTWKFSPVGVLFRKIIFDFFSKSGISKISKLLYMVRMIYKRESASEKKKIHDPAKWSVSVHTR